VAHEVSPLADLAHLALLPARGYRPVEFTAVLHQPLDAGDPRPVPSGITARLVGGDEAEAWAATAAGGWGESPEVAAFMLDFGAVTARSAGTHCFVAESDGAAVGTGAVALHGGVALLAGASTLPEWRGRGAQAALLDARLRHAAAHGCDIAMLAALPGSASQRNAERRGFRIAYTRLKWVRERG
jgi:GNAT superfamily N-acetyltransferase